MRQTEKPASIKSGQRMDVEVLCLPSSLYLSLYELCNAPSSRTINFISAHVLFIDVNSFSVPDRPALKGNFIISLSLRGGILMNLLRLIWTTVSENDGMAIKTNCSLMRPIAQLVIYARLFPSARRAYLWRRRTQTERESVWRARKMERSAINHACIFN